MDKKMQIEILKTRISLLESRGKKSQGVIRKLKRQLRNLEL